MFIYRLLAGALLLALGTRVAAAQAELDLGSAMARARAGAGEVAAARSRAAAASARERGARGIRWPELHLSETWAHTDSPAEAFAFALNQERFSFPAFAASDPNAPAPISTAITRLEIRFPLWTGGEIDGRLAQAAAGARAARSAADWTADQAALAAGEAWVRLSEARAAVRLLERSRATVAAHLELARQYAAQGMLVRSDLLRAEVELARMDDLLAEARGGERLAESALAFRLGDAEDRTYDLAPLADPPPAGGLDAWIARAGERADLAAARELLVAGEQEVRARRAAYFPKVGVAARHDLVDDRLFGGHGESTSVYAGATIALFDGGRRAAAVAEARAELEAGRADVDRLARGVRLAVRDAWERATVAASRRDTARHALESAAEAERIVGERFRSGVARSLDVLDAATARREAETRALTAAAEAQLAVLELAVAAGRAPESVLVSPIPGGQP
ncbi:MAG: TolC family protein [Thermoanaerobaculia bacterium]